jgi:hypothetical protein
VIEDNRHAESPVVYTFALDKEHVTDACARKVMRADIDGVSGDLCLKDTQCLNCLVKREGINYPLED